MTTEQYVETGGTRCPFCGSQSIEGDSFEVDAGGAAQEVGCNNCDKTWTDVYTLTKYEARP